ncbi:MAG: hypothetical protein LN588_04190 [Rickettsia endosymbiont of Bryobia graminum]|nr:hypothetical protein [Rickettsia endosymbiont of Bryobia graminum]
MSKKAKQDSAAETTKFVLEPIKPQMTSAHISSKSAVPPPQCQACNNSGIA